MGNDEINDEKRAGQLHLFKGMNLRRGIVPTDIDIFAGVRMFIEYNTRLFILGEGKYKTDTMKVAQRQAFESLCDAISRVENYEMWILLYKHEVEDTDEPVIVKDQYVTGVFSSFNLKWRKPTDIDVIPKFETIDEGLTMLMAIHQIENWCEDNCKFSI